MAQVSLSAPASTSLASTFNPPAPFTCSWNRDGLGSAWLELHGELDLATSPLFRRSLAEAQASVSAVSIDLQALEFIDCSGLQVIVDAHVRAQGAGERLSLVRGSGQVDRVLELTGLLERIEVADV